MLLRFVLIMMCLLSLVAADFEVWKSKVGSELKAKLKEINKDYLILERENGKLLKVAFSDFAEEEEERLNSLLGEYYGSKVEGVAAQVGEISSEIEVIEDSRWHYYVYLPKGFHTGKNWPVWFITSSGGGNKGAPLKKYISGAEALGCVLVVSKESKNKFVKSKTAVLAVTKDVYQRFPVEPKFAFTSGMSGGSRMAYLTAEYFDEIVGILACGSGSGIYLEDESFRDAKLRSNTYVYSLIGTNCFNRTGAYLSHTRFPKEYRLRFFEGGHVWANSKLLEEGMFRVMGEALFKKGDFSIYRRNYLKALQKKVKSLIEEEPWEAHSLASLGVKLTRENGQESEFESILQNLSKDPRVNLAQQAEAKMLKLGEEFYLKYTYFNGDRERKEDRLSRAREYAKPYESIPHGDVLELLGKKSR